ncbi:dynein heavy chain [Pseudoscourfieldia marina]
MLRMRWDVSDSHDDLFVERKNFFGGYMRMGATGDDRVYEQVLDTDKMHNILLAYLEDYNASATNQMNLVFFADAMEHLVRLCRILRQPRGNAMLVGVGGSGKQSMTRFACFMAEYKCFSIELTRSYGMTEFREDLKNPYKMAGIDGDNCCFLFTDSQIMSETQLEDINNMLNSGEVPGMYGNDDKEKIIADIRPYAQERGIPETREALYQAFVNRVRNNLHIVLCMSPVGEAFRSRCRQNPSLIRCTTSDWYTDWPEAALHSVAERFLEKVKLENDEVHASVVEMCVTIHTSIAAMSERMFTELRRRYYITPKSYLDLINLYVQLLAEKREEYTEARDRLLNGLMKLNETNEVVDTLRDEITRMQPILAEKAEATAVLLVQVNKDKEEAEKVKAVVAVEEAEVKKSTAETQAIKDDAEADLAEALPALEAAQKALNALNKNDIVEIKGFVKPPSLVQLTMEAVCTLLGEKTDWDSAKKVLTDGNFLKRLFDYDKDAIEPKVLKQLKKYVDDPVYTPDQVAKQSVAAKSLCMWSRAMDLYAKVAKVVEPKRKALREAEESLQGMQAALAEKQAQLKAVVDNVAALEKQLQDAMDEQQQLKDDMELSEKRLVRAGKLKRRHSVTRLCAGMKRPRRLERTWCFSLVTFSSAPLAYPTTAHSRERTETKSSTTGSRRQRKEKFPSVNRLVCRARCLSPIVTRE